MLKMRATFKSLCCAMLVLLVPTCHGYGGGAPRSTCRSLWPAHGSQNRPQAHYTPPDGPYNITFRLKTGQEPATAPPGALAYEQNQIFEVTLSGSDTFKGFIVQARKVGTREAVGSFSGNEYSFNFKDICDNKSALTHRYARTKESVMAEWRAPSQAVGDINFVASFVKDFSTYWVAIKSEVLYDSTQVTTLPPTTTTTTTAATRTLTRNATDVCQESLLEPLNTQRPHVAILCSNDSHCPCGWVCCPECVDDVTETCGGYAICRQPRDLDVVEEEVAEESVEFVGEN